MLISSKGRYALKLMIYIAAIGGDPVGESMLSRGVALISNPFEGRGFGCGACVGARGRCAIRAKL